MTTKEFKDKIKAINDKLKSGEPDNFTADHKGYTGYKPQHIIDAINTEFCGEWSLTIQGREVYKNDKFDVAFVHVRLTLRGQSVDAMASHPNTQNDIGDAFKSAQTDAMKKAFAHFSIGNRAYYGLLKNNK